MRKTTEALKHYLNCKIKEPALNFLMENDLLGSS
jgi:hypothetical protein